MSHLWGKPYLQIGDPKKEVQRVITNHKWYEVNHAINLEPYSYDLEY